MIEITFISWTLLPGVQSLTFHVVHVDVYISQVHHLSPQNWEKQQNAENIKFVAPKLLLPTW